VQSIIAFSESEDDVFMAGVNATLACAFDPLPVVEVGFLLCVEVEVVLFDSMVCQVSSVMMSILRRSLHGGLFSVVGCFVQVFNVPIITPENLCEFFKASQVRYLSIAGPGV